MNIKRRSYTRKNKFGGAFEVIANSIRNKSVDTIMILTKTTNTNFKYSPFTSAFTVSNDEYNKIIDKYDLTSYIESLNNNVLGTYEKQVLSDEINGGAKENTVLQYANISNFNFSKLRRYCKEFYSSDVNNVDEILHNYNTAIGVISGECSLAQLTLTKEEKQNIEDQVNYFNTNMQDIQKIMQDNNGKKIIPYQIRFDKIEVDKYLVQFSSSLVQDTTQKRAIKPYKFDKCFEYYDFNKDIILGYQGYQLQYFQDNNAEINNYITAQNNYIKKLSDKQKRVLTDYTRYKSFTLYQEYVKASEKNFVGHPIVANFFTSVQGYKPEKTEGGINNTLLEEMGNAFIDFIEELNIFNLDNYKSFYSMGYNDKASKSYLDITDVQWQQIISMYLKELNSIILDAPRVPKRFICYRGVSNDYTIPKNSINAKDRTVPAYISSRTGSISLNYEKSKYYYDLGTDKSKSTMYRVLVLEGSQILFVSPLASDEIIEELEFITPLNQIYISESWHRQEKFNNYKNKNNICMTKTDRINSKDLILLPSDYDPSKI
jgi:hypothetical protein